MMEKFVEWLMKFVEGDSGDKEAGIMLKECEIERLKSLRRK